MKATALWQHIWNDQAPARGLEQLRLDGRQADASMLAFDERGEPYRLVYRMDFDERWRPRRCHIRVEGGFGVRELHLRRNPRNEWRDGPGNRLRTLDGCQDLDLWPTPFTNSPAAWRLGLARDQREEIAVVFIEAPTLEVRVMHQAYTRLDARHLLYQNLDGSGFHAVLRLAADGLVEDYPGLFQRLHRVPPC